MYVQIWQARIYFLGKDMEIVQARECDGKFVNRYVLFDFIAWNFWGVIYTSNMWHGESWTNKPMFAFSVRGVNRFPPKRTLRYYCEMFSRKEAFLYYFNKPFFFFFLILKLLSKQDAVKRTE